MSRGPRPDWRASSPLWRLDADNPRLVALVDRARCADLAEPVGTFGIVAAIVGLLWMVGKCGPTLFPCLFQ